MRELGTGPPILALHGFSSTGAQWADLGTRLGTSILAPDLPGHGRSTVAVDGVDDVVDAIVDILERCDAPLPIIGYSQGGRMAILTALRRPDLVSSLIAISASPGIADPEARRRRRESDAALAAQIETLGIDRFLDLWLTRPVTSTEHLDPALRAADRAVRSDNTAEGLADALRRYGQGAQPYVGDRLADLPMSTWFVAGRADLRYAGLAVEMAVAAPHGRAAIVPGGHNVVLDAPTELAAVIDRALGQSRTGPRPVSSQ